jgi:hypothetical protein
MGADLVPTVPILRTVWFCAKKVTTLPQLTVHTLRTYIPNFSVILPYAWKLETNTVPLFESFFTIEKDENFEKKKCTVKINFYCASKTLILIPVMV